MKVLVVDDIPQNSYLLEALLKGHGYQVSVAGNGREALEQLQRDPADLIISDILMPKMDGFQLCREVKTDDRLKSIPFVFYTATYTSEEDRQFALSLGASRFILKPSRPEEFIAIIREVLLEGERAAAMPRREPEQETEYLRGHQARLIKKLEDKISQLELAEERYRSLIACAEDAIITLDESGRIDSWNEAAVRMFGYDADEAIGKDFSLLLPDQPGPRPDVLVTRTKEKRQVGCVESVKKAKNGETIPVSTVLSPIRNRQGEHFGMSAIIRDMRPLLSQKG